MLHPDCCENLLYQPQTSSEIAGGGGTKPFGLTGQFCVCLFFKKNLGHNLQAPKCHTHWHTGIFSQVQAPKNISGLPRLCGVKKKKRERYFYHKLL